MATTIDTPRFSIEPFFIGPDERRLFGVLTKPPEGPAAGPGLLICYPIGDEYLLVHRTLAQLAIKLAGLGVSTLRFDYHGTGDSPGTGGVGSLDELAGDVAVAAQEPRLRDHGRAFGILGARLGAALALRFAEREAPADFMVLWDPVVRGRDYVEALRQAQQGSFLAPLLSQDPFEYGGFVYPRGLLDQLDGLDADDSFFDLGGDSVEAVSAALEIEKRAGIALSLTDFAYQSFDQLVRLYGETLSAAERERP